METYSSSFVDIKLIEERPDAADNICGLESSECSRRLQISDQNLLSVTPMQTTLLKPRVPKEAKGLRKESPQTRAAPQLLALPGSSRGTPAPPARGDAGYSGEIYLGYILNLQDKNNN